MKHLNDDEITQYAFDPSSLENRDACERHVAECRECREAIDLQKLVDQGLRDNEPWMLADALSTRQRRDALGSQSLKLAEESQRADEFLSPLIGNPLLFLKAGVEDAPEVRSAGGVQVLCRAANSMCEKRPEHALHLADTAASIAAALPPARYRGGIVFGLQGLAWKERANALRILSRHGEALAALDRAERAYKQQRVNVYELAVVRYVRGSVYYSAEQYQLAIAAADEAAAIFDAIPDRSRSRDAHVLKATALHKLHRYRDAQLIFRRLLAEGEQAGDLLFAARVANDLGSSEVALREFASARQHLERALRLFTEFGLTTEILRARWILTRLLMAEGDYPTANAGFAVVRDEFTHLRLHNEAALAELDRIEILVLEGRRAEVTRAARAVKLTFEDAGMFTSALTAIAYLEEVAEKGRVTLAHVDHVRQFVEKVPRHPHRVFLPLPDSAFPR